VKYSCVYFKLYLFRQQIDDKILRI
jgi:hypothetical protein